MNMYFIGPTPFASATYNPAPVSGTKTQHSEIVAGAHQHYFSNATTALSVDATDKLVCYVWLDPAHPPRNITLQWNDGSSWEHRAYWGENLMGWGVDGTVSNYRMGDLPAKGQWVRLEVPASVVGLGGQQVRGMAFSLFDGRAWWDAAGKRAASTSSDTIWCDDSLPAGATATADGGDSWTWTQASVESDFGFTGHYYHEPSKLHLALYRAYDAKLGRWISRDPIGERAGINLYAYVENNPIGWIDPLGLDTYSINRQLGGDELRSNLNPFTHTFCYTTNPDGSLKSTYSLANKANPRGWNKDQPEDKKAANEAIKAKSDQKEGGADLDPKVDKAFNELNKKENEHANGVITNNCKKETKNLLEKAKASQ